MSKGRGSQENAINQIMRTIQNDWIKENRSEIENFNRIQKEIVCVLYKNLVFSNLNCMNMSEIARMIGCTKMSVSMNVPRLVDLKIIKLAPYQRGRSRSIWLNKKDYPIWVNVVLVKLGLKNF